MSKQEIRFLAIYSILLIFLTTIPYFLGFQQEEGRDFTGFVFGVEDGNSYIAKMLRGTSAEWLFRTPYTWVEQRGVLTFLPFTLLGKLAGGEETHTQLVVLYHLLRCIAIPLVVYALYVFIGLFTDDFYWRKIGVLMATIGGGLGWLVLAMGQTEIFGSIPLEFYSPETFGFLSILGLPHLIVSRAFLLLGLTLFLTSGGNQSRAFLAGAAFLVAGLFQPLTMAIAILLIGIYTGISLILNLVGFMEIDSRNLIFSCLKTLIIPLPYFLYLLFAFTFDPFLVSWTTQNIIRSPHPIHYVLAFVVVLIPAAFGGWVILRKRAPKGILLIIWALLLPLLAYAPHNLQRRLPDGLWIAVITLGMVAFTYWSSANEKVHWAGIAMILVTIPSSLLLLVGAVRTVSTVEAPVFQNSKQVAAFLWIQQNVEHDDVVLAAYETANPLPAWASIRVLAGHGPESIDLDIVLAKISDFYGDFPDFSDEDRLNFLQTYGVKYVFYGPNERALGEWDPAGSSFLHEVYRSGAYLIYIVDQELFLSSGEISIDIQGDNQKVQ